MPCEGDEHAHRHVELAQLGGAAEVRQIEMKQQASACAPS
jgi:hypothetical protein